MSRQELPFAILLPVWIPACAGMGAEGAHITILAKARIQSRYRGTLRLFSCSVAPDVGMGTAVNTLNDIGLVLSCSRERAPLAGEAQERMRV